MKDYESLLQQYGYGIAEQFNTGPLFIYHANPLAKPAILLDTELFGLHPQHYHYVEYTNLQNRLMHQYAGLLRFLPESVSDLKNQIDIFLGESEPVDAIKVFGEDRTEKHVDPTPPEYNFALIFENVFGGKALHALKAEVSYVDKTGVRRFIDYELKKTTGSVAIELNGESYHHPLVIQHKRYRSQLMKQNSLVSDGKKVFRWSNRGMADSVKISDQLREYFGDPNHFVSNPAYFARRNVSTFDLYAHQKDTLKRIETERAAGKTTFLVVLPTGTGKTEVFIEDVRKQIEQHKVSKVLVLVPTRELKMQTQKRIQSQCPAFTVGDNLEDKPQILVQTNAYLLRHYEAFKRDAFDYILVDEAHRSAAHGLRKVLEYFTPNTLIGLTATHERLDQQKLEDIFGSYEVDLTLEEAIKKGIVPPIRAFRLQSNIDFSEVRFNGNDFVKSDLNRTILTTSRDQLIVDVLKQYFSTPLQYEQLPQGIVFCVDVKHTKRMARCLNAHGITAASVHAGDRHGVEQYKNGDIQFLCACELLNEGWDAPQTQVVVMARPTMSKVLYTQQLGRGTRQYPGKEALYVIDVVDSYGAALPALSVHSLLQVPHYIPFGDVVRVETGSRVSELTVLDGLYEGVRRIEEIDIFSFEKEYGDLLNEEQLARELFVSTGTVKSWIKNGDVAPAKSIQFGKGKLNFFMPEQVPAIRESKGLKERTEASRYDDFFEFLESRDYTFSYKIVFLLSLIKHVNAQGEATIDEIVSSYQRFYINVLQQYGKAEKNGNPLNKQVNLSDAAYLQRSIRQNPFEKFERKRFMYQCKDLEIIAFDSVLWEKLTHADLEQIRGQMIDDGIKYFAKLDIVLTHNDFACLLK